MQLPDSMNAMILERQGSPLSLKRVPLQRPGQNQVLVKVLACGICRTDLHILDGELTQPKLPLIPGHEIIGRVVELGRGVSSIEVGTLVGIPWLAYTCGQCSYCLRGRENLCEQALFTGYTVDGGFAEYTVAYSSYCFPLPEVFAYPSAAPLLCAGLIGYRSYCMIPASAMRIGIYGFGAAAHILIQLACSQNKEIYAFTRDGDLKTQSFAMELGAAWAGNASDRPPQVLDAAIIFAPVGELVPKALKDVDKGGAVVCGGIHMSDIPSFPYQLLWGERRLQSVANLTRTDGVSFVNLVSRHPVKTETVLYTLSKANEAISDLKKGNIKGAAVLVMD